MTTEYYAVKFGNDNEVMTLEELARMYEDGNDGSDKRSFETWLDCIATPLADPRDTDMMRLIRMVRNLQVLGDDWHMSGFYGEYYDCYAEASDLWKIVRVARRLGSRSEAVERMLHEHCVEWNTSEAEMLKERRVPNDCIW